MIRAPINAISQLSKVENTGFRALAQDVLSNVSSRGHLEENLGRIASLGWLIWSFFPSR
jgi:hypothetical protein